MPQLLFELLSEEIPARMQARAADDLKRLVCDGLKEAGLPFDAARAVVTPRRLALAVDGLPDKQPDVSEERRGPKADAPEKAIAGFLGSVGLTLDEVEKRETPKGVFLFAVIARQGRATVEVLPDLLGKALAALPWPKSMRWADHKVRWVRPLHGIVCLFDGHVVPLQFPPVGAGSTTVGHRFLAPASIAVDGFDDYREKLLAAKVMVDPAERRRRIDDGARRLAAEAGVTLKEDPGLLDEVTGLVEWPVVLMGTIDEQFMDVPQEVLITSMRAHQKYFSCLDAEGRLANRFIVVSNMETADGGAQIVAGNERVLRARLSDAKFFWDQDRKKPLADRVPSLADSIFHAKLGSMAAKVERIVALTRELCPFVPGADVAMAERAAYLGKADLATEMVFEFTELQGIMGRYYAVNDGEDAAVAAAIAEHYAPQGPGDACPTAPVSVVVALADKIDTLIGFFAIGETPTGSKDPFALRRAALGVIRLIIENGLRLPLAKAFKEAHRLYVHDLGAMPQGEEAVVGQLLDFFADRLKVHLRERGVRHDLISAVFALGGEDDLVRLLARVDALGDFLGSDDGANLLTAYRRAANILRIEEKKDGRRHDGDPETGLLAQDEERVLVADLAKVAEDSADALRREAFAEAMSALARLRGPVDAFFDEVTVNCDEPDTRINRLRLLSRIRGALEGVADFSKIEG